VWNVSVSSTVARFEMALRTQLRDRLATPVAGAAFTPLAPRHRSRPPTAADISWPTIRLPQCFGGAGPEHKPTVTNKPAAIASTTRCMLAPSGRLILTTFGETGSGSSSRSSASRNAKRGGRKAIRGACHSSQSTATPRIFSQWKSGAMKPGSGIPGAETACGRAGAMAASASGVPSIVPAHHRNSVGEADTLKGPRTPVWALLFQTAHKPPTAVPPWHRLRGRAWHPTVAGLQGRFWRGNPAQRLP